MKKVIVTGANGFIGKNLIPPLLKKGCEVIAFDRKPFKLNGIKYCIAEDLNQKGVLDPFLDSETTIFHLAAQASVPKSVENPVQDLHSTFLSFFNVLESIRFKGGSLVFPSTASVFDSNNRLPLSEKSYIKPTAPYAAAKVAGEAYCAAYQRCYGVKTKIARMFSVYGVGMDRFVIHDLIRKIQKDPNRLTVLGDGRQIRDYLYIDDVIDGLVLIAEKGVPGEDYNLASGEPVKILDLAKLIAEKMGHKGIPIKLTGASFPGDIPKWYADISKIKSIGFKPKVNLEEGIALTIEWLLKREVVDV